MYMCTSNFNEMKKKLVFFKLSIRKEEFGAHPPPPLQPKQAKAINVLLPPASEGWGKVIFSVCSHLWGGGRYPIRGLAWRGGGGYPVSGLGGGGYPVPGLGGGGGGTHFRSG